MATDAITRLGQEGFGQEVGFGLRPALLVIDFISGFTDPTAELGLDASAEIAHTNRLIRASRQAKLPIVFSTIRYDHQTLEDAGLWIRKIHGLRSLSIASGGGEIDGRLLRESSDQVLIKKFASCFFGTDLLTRLISARVDTLILAGCTTSGCIRATAVDACQYGFHTIIVREAVIDRLAAAHEQSLIDIQLKYGDVLGIDQVVARLSSGNVSG
jgi:maleamate amidohydrolase